MKPKKKTLWIDLVVSLGLALPGVSVYRIAPDWIFAYAGAACWAMLAFLIFWSWLTRPRGTDDVA